MLNIENEQSLITIDEPLVEKLEAALDAVATGEGVEYEAEVSLFFVTEDAIRQINREHRAKDDVTDVLSFPVLGYAPDQVFAQCYGEADLRDEMFLDDRLLLGDVLICTGRAAEQAADYGHSLEREVVFLFVHSLLHLLGYDHMSEEQRSRMTQRERFYMAELGVDR